jgi:hypothetical protein
MDYILANKKILYLGTVFYDYDKIIIKQLKEYGASITYYIVFKKSKLWHILHNIKNKYITTLCEKKLTDFIQKDKTKYDYIFVINGEWIKSDSLSFLKTRQLNAVFILYLWDSVSRLKLDSIFPYFDKIFTFDHEDAYNYGFIFRPLFFRPEIKNIIGIKKKYDFVFIGSGHSDRIRVLKNLRGYFLNKKCKVFIKLFYGKMTVLNFLVQKKINLYDLSMFLLNPISAKKYCKIIARSRYVLDIPYPGQKGLTIRVFDVLASGCFLITTNSDITKYTDIPCSSYFILNRDGSNIEDLNIDISRSCCSIENISYYSLEQFVADIFML